MATANIRAVITAEDNASKVVQTFGSNVGKSSDKIVTANQKTGASFTQLLAATAALGVTSHKLLGVIEDSVTAANKYQASLIGLTSISNAYGQSADKAKQAAEDLAKDGLMTVTDAARGLKNLLQSGFSLDQAITLMKRFKDSAAFGRQSALSFGDAIASATEGIKNGNSILVDNAGVTKNLSVILEEAGFSAQDLMRATTDASVRQALFNGIIKETNAQTGDAAKLVETFAGKQAMLTAKTTVLRQEIGEALQPALLKLLEVVTPFVEKFAKFATDHPQIVAAFLLITTAGIGLLAVLASIGLAVIGLGPIFGAFAAGSSAAIGVVSAAFGGLRALIAMPLFMPAIVVAAAIASLVSVVKAVQEVRQAINDVNNSARAANSLANESQMRELQRQATAARAAGDTQKAQQISNALAALGGGRAMGGPVSGGTPYVVGEQGPELFVPKQSGNIVPNHAMGGSVNVNVNVGMYAGTEMEKRRMAQTLFEALKDVAQSKNTTLQRMME